MAGRINDPNERLSRSSFFQRIIRWPIEAALFYFFISLLYAMPPAMASGFMAGLFRLLGPLTHYHRRSLVNLSHAMPELSASERQQICRKMWDNLGRVLGEYPHVKRLMTSDRLIIDGAEHLASLDEKGGFLIGAHLGNWELAITPALHRGLIINGVFRGANNPYITRLLARRTRIFNHIYEKGTAGARGLSLSVKRGEVFAMLVDQKLREGMLLDFFGRPASTPVAHIRQVQRYNVPIVMIRVIRLKGCRFRVVVRPLDLSDIDPSSPDFTGAVGTRINGIIEGWIREYPEQWLWPHRRWK